MTNSPVAAEPSAFWTTRLSQQARNRKDALGGILALANADGVVNFSGGFPDPALFPTGALRDISLRLLDEDAAVALQYTPSEGLASTRDAVADRIWATDGHRPDGGELMITSGGIDAITLIARTMLDPGDVVVTEEPSYLGAIAGFAACGADVRGVPMDPDGFDVDAFGAMLAALGPAPKLVYLIPDHQNPSGRRLSTDRRQTVVDLCRRHGVLAVEDVAYSELGFAGARRPSLYSLGPDVVVQIGTFSKTFFPGARLGWAAGPAAIVSQLAVAKQNSDQCSGALGQRMVEEFLRSGRYDEHLGHARALYRRRAETMTAALQAHVGDRGTWTTPAGGFFSWLRLPGVDTTALAARARAADVAFVPGAGFFVQSRDTEHLRLSFSRVSEADIDRGIARLAAAARTVRG